MATVYIQPGTGTGAGTLADPYYYSELGSAETAAGNGGTILFTDGTYTFTAPQTWDAGNFSDMTYKSLNRNGAYLLGDTLSRGLFIGGTSTSTVKVEGFKAGNVHYDAEHSTTLTINLITHADTLVDGPGNYGLLGSTNNNQSHICTNSSFAVKYDTAAGKFGVYWNTNATIDHCSFFIDCPTPPTGGITSTGFGASITDSVIMSNNSSAIASTALTIGNCTNCCVYQMHSGDSSGGTNNIFVDPQFVDSANGDLRLRPTSPLIGAASV